MYELKKTLVLLVLSAPILFGVNRLTSSLNNFSDPTLFALDRDDISTQAYGKGAYQDYQVRRYGN